MGDWAAARRRWVAGRSPPRAVGSRGWAREARPSIRLGKAAKVRCCEGQSVAGCAATGGRPTRWHSYLMTDAATTRLSRPPIVGPRRLARTMQALRPDRPHSGLRSRLVAVASDATTRRARPGAARCVRARRHGGTRAGINALRRRRAARRLARGSGFLAAGRRRRRRASTATRPGGRRAAAGRSTTGLPWRPRRRSIRSRTAG